mmetsp:Transcript_38621/g.121663  ORF Transcript_38621/g.121663 Transcript_38621/m.121663 type:complete len:332 (-) Transcript_38621:756-1751(-)
MQCQQAGEGGTQLGGRVIGRAVPAGARQHKRASALPPRDAEQLLKGRLELPCEKRGLHASQLDGRNARGVVEGEASRRHGPIRVRLGRKSAPLKLWVGLCLLRPATSALLLHRAHRSHLGKGLLGESAPLERREVESGSSRRGVHRRCESPRPRLRRRRRRAHVLHEADASGLRCAQLIIAQVELHRGGVPHHLGEAAREEAGRREAARKLAVLEGGVLRGDDAVREQRDRHAAAQHGAVHRADDRDRQRPQRDKAGKQVDRPPRRRRRGFEGVSAEPVRVAARTKVRPSPLQNHRLDASRRLRAEPLHRSQHVVRHLGADGVEVLGVVQL